MSSNGEDRTRIGRRRSAPAPRGGAARDRRALERLERAVYRPARARGGIGARRSSSPWAGRPRGHGAGFGPALATQGRGRFNGRQLLLAAGAAAVVTALAVGAVALATRPRFVPAQEVLFGGRSIAVAASEQSVRAQLEAIQTDLKKTYGMDVKLAEEVTFRPVTCDSRYLSTDVAIRQALKNNVDVDVVATVVKVNDRPAVALHSAAEAQQALDDVLAPFRDAPADRNRTDIGFVEKVDIAEMPIDYGLVCTREEAARTLSMGAGVEDNYYTVKKGDSLSRIAKKFKLKVSDLRKANPEVASNDVIQPDQKINAVKPNKWLNVRFTDTVTREEELSFDTVEQKDATLYTTQKQTKQEGKAGKREVVAKITYINGMEAQKDIVSQTVLQAAVDKIVLRGTKKVPVNGAGNAGAGAVGSSSMFSWPLKSYRLTSTFKIRTLQGVTRWHYGDDLAAPTGTPIYAARAGTVNFAGSSSGYGLLVKISHEAGFESRYGHCSKLLVKKGQKVDKGQIIALVGSTGHSTGPHCHYELRINGTPVDPMKYTK